MNLNPNIDQGYQYHEPRQTRVDPGFKYEGGRTPDGNIGNRF
jgi:hypothetical protein